jgi:hypothetical protein
MDLISRIYEKDGHYLIGFGPEAYEIALGFIEDQFDNWYPNEFFLFTGLEINEDNQVVAIESVEKVVSFYDFN